MGKNSIGKEVLDQIVEHAAKVAVDTYNQQHEYEERKKFDKRLNNIRLLLEHYRDFVNYEEKAIYRIYEELDEDVIDIIEMMEGRKSDRDGRIESIEKGVMRTKIIMNHVNAMLEIYKKSCDNSPYPEEGRRYRVIYGLYLKEVPDSVQEIADIEGIAERTVYKDATAAFKRLTALIFGIDGFHR